MSPGFCHWEVGFAAGSVAKNSHLKLPVTVNPVQKHLPSTPGSTCSSRDSSRALLKLQKRKCICMDGDPFSALGKPERNQKS